MEHEVIRRFESWQELGQFISARADRGPYDEVPFRDENGEPLTPEQMLALVREIEGETGQKLIYRRGERRRAA